ncbi:transthyretin precursor [Dictyocaulus viviparus]|uniref:Transthyretin n=1 Tax=Dictyocaulus viviparus TaxID=29172 RepID=A0A0D8XL00_DICVI|nr:transthyretin precursor [Dictyocaulus viviparus]
MYGLSKCQDSSLVLLFMVTSAVTSPQPPKASISTHVLDIAMGKPAEGVVVFAYVEDSNQWKLIECQDSSLVLLFMVTSAVTSPQPPKASISTHVLDIAMGKPAEGVVVFAYVEDSNQWKLIGNRSTGCDGRSPWVSPNVPLMTSNYKLKFMTGDYYNRMGMLTFFPNIERSQDIGWLSMRSIQKWNIVALMRLIFYCEEVDLLMCSSQDIRIVATFCISWTNDDVTDGRDVTILAHHLTVIPYESNQ